MPTIHVVQPGESLSSIAKQHGFADWRALYDHPANVKLRSARPNPDLIHPGDKVFIPDKKPSALTAATDKSHTFKVKTGKPKSETFTRNLTILVHGVNTDAAWFGLVEAEMARYQDAIDAAEKTAEHKLRYAIVPFTWGDYENTSQGGYPNYAVDEVHQMFENPAFGYDRIYQGHAAVRLKELIDQAKTLGAQVNVIAHSNGTLITCGALMLGTSIDNFILMGSPLDCDNDTSQKELARAITHVSGTVTNFWSSGDEWAYLKGGIGAFGANADYRKANPGIVNVRFYKGAVIEGVKIKEDEIDHSDYMLAEHMPIFSSYIRRFAEKATKVKHDAAKVEALRKQGDWTTMSYYKEKKNITLESPEMKKYQAQIEAIKP
ncbi:LysM peptidoglycan-binding domain-containing protein [Chondromyces apiculatus]|uniref:LysM domain-containing protein n=1 Tax=Chondromyces apiculatus DSM 436 TaxID=1192034 RepID=A0A017T0U3_9BACT|nr:LysM domain-containing protein [Chondromyces apiculatus]EYF02879.1 Hypothetical protein CAP_6459 [Chondromyces apiculatus DSM 436]